MVGKAAFNVGVHFPVYLHPLLTGYAGHHELWLGGIQHGDISLRNLKRLRSRSNLWRAIWRRTTNWDHHLYGF